MLTPTPTGNIGAKPCLNQPLPRLPAAGHGRPRGAVATPSGPRCQRASAERRPARRPAGLARDTTLPASTLRHWLHRQQALEAPTEEVLFFESPAGLAFLHRLQVAAHSVFTQQGPAGLH